MIAKLTTIEEIKNSAITLSTNNINKMKDFGFEDISMPEFPFPDFPIVKSVEELTDCDKFLEQIFALKEAPTNVKQFLQIQGQQIKQTFQIIYKNMINQLVQMKDLITNLWKNVKKLAKEIIDSIKEQYKIIISYFKAEFNKIINLWKKLKKALSKEEREKIKEKIKQEAKRYGGEVLEMLGIIQLYETLKELWNALKNMWGMAKSGWKSIIDNFKNLKSLLKDNNTPLGKAILAWVVALLPLIAQLSLAILGAIKLAKEQQDLNDKLLNDGIKEIESPVDNNVYSELLLKAIETTRKQNESNNTNNSINNNLNKDTSCFSICPIEYENDKIIDEKSGGYLLEMGIDIDNFTFSKNVLDTIKIDDEIGYINGTPIKSKIEGTVLEKKNRHIIVKPNEINKNFSIDISTNQKTKFEELSDTFNNINKIESILKDDILYIYKTILYKNFINIKLTEETLDNRNDIIIKNHQKNIESLEKKIKDKTTKKYIQDKINNDDLLSIKEEIMEIKNNFFKEIINTFQKNDISLYSSKECNYKLLDYYYEFISNIIYDQDNSFKIELFDLILSFIKDRMQIEKFDKNKIIKDINSIAVSNIEKNIKLTTNKNYFNIINSWNLNSIKDVYEAIKSNCNIKQVENKNYEFNSDNEEDIKSLTNIINNEENNSYPSLSDEDMYNIKKDTIAKKISILYYLWKNIKVNNESKKTEEEIIVLLKKQTQIEYDKIKKYFNNILNKYNQYNENIKNIDNFFNEINWPSPTEIYIDNTKYIHYIFRNNKGNNSNNNNSNNISKEDGENQLSTKTLEEPSSYLYWLRYCGMATLMNCAMPIYWGTGLIITGIPIPLPIILIPIYVLNGNCICVFGLGICGIAIYPMMIYSNLSTNMMTYLAPINVIIDLVKNTLNMLKQQTKDMIKPMLSGPIETINNQIKETEKEINSMKKEISLIKSM